jgi:hypothetical protein
MLMATCAFAGIRRSSPVPTAAALTTTMIAGWLVLRDRVDQKYLKIERGMDADIAAHDTRMARTNQDVSQWKSSEMLPVPPAASGEIKAINTT